MTDPRTTRTTAEDAAEITQLARTLARRLDRGDDRIDPAQREAFLAAVREPGDAAVASVVEWLGGFREFERVVDRELLAKTVIHYWAQT
jgi:hypothetical protein